MNRYQSHGRGLPGINGVLSIILVAFVVSCARHGSTQDAQYPGTDPDLIPMIANGSGGYVEAPISETYETRVHGRVVSAETGDPVPGCPIAACFTFPHAAYGRTYGVVAQRTDAEGHFSFQNLRPGMWLLMIQDEEQGFTNDGLRDDWPSVFLADANSTAGPVDVVAASGKQLTLNVTDARTGAPVANAWTAIGGAFNAVKRTDSEGRVSFHSVNPERTYVRVVAEGYAEYLLQVALGSADSYSYNVTLNPGGAISGRVVDERGAPVVGMYIRQTSYSPMYGSHDQSDADGTYRLVGLAHGATAYIRYGVPMGSLGPLDTFPYSLITSLDAEESEKTIDVTIPDRQLYFDGAIEGRVMDSDGNPVQGAVVTYGWFEDVDRPSDVTDAEGSYRLEHVDEPLAAPARYLRVRAPGFPVTWSRIEPGPMKKPRRFDVRLESDAHSVSGRVLEADGSAPQYPVIVTALDQGIPVDRAIAPAGDGSFNLPCVNPRVQIEFTQGNSIPMPKSLDLDRENPDARLHPIRAGMIRVVDATTGEPVSEFKLLGSYWNEALGLTVLNEEGAYVLRTRQASPFSRVSILAPGYLPLSEQTIALGEKDKVPSVTVQLTPARTTTTVAGILVDPDGKPHAGKEVSLIRYAATDRSHAYDAWGNDPDGWQSVESAERLKTDADGRFSFSGVPATGQSVDLIVSDSSIARTRFRIEERPAESWSDLKLEVGYGARVRGHWNLDLAQRPPRVLYLFRTDPDESFWITVYVDHLTGEFEFPAVQPGTYRLESDPSTLPDKRFELAEGDVHELELGFEALGSIRGQLTEETGRWANRMVMLRVGDGIWADKIVAQSTDADGRFEFNELLPGNYSLALNTEEAGAATSDFNFFLDDQWWLGTAFAKATQTINVSLENDEAIVQFASPAPGGVIRNRFAQNP